VDEIFFEADVATDDHGHDLEQAAYHVSGLFEIHLGDEVVTLGPGDGYAIPANAPHSVRCLEQGSYILVTARNAGGGSDNHDHDNDHHGHDGAHHH
jgi:quercetin dioxygenase-like cupin family protein